MGFLTFWFGLALTRSSPPRSFSRPPSTTPHPARLRPLGGTVPRLVRRRGALELTHVLTGQATVEISVEQARKLLRSLDLGHVVGLRDRAVLGVLAYTGARVGAVARLRLGDLRNFGEQRALRFREKGGKVREIPVRHDLDAWLRAYLDAAGIAGQDGKLALFRAADGKRRQLTPAGYRAHSMRQMLKRRLEDAGLPHLFSPHSFRVAVVTDLLNQNVPLEDVQYLAGHSNPRTTQIYDRRRRRVTRNIVERISI